MAVTRHPSSRTSPTHCGSAGRGKARPLAPPAKTIRSGKTLASPTGRGGRGEGGVPALDSLRLWIAGYLWWGGKVSASDSPPVPRLRRMAGLAGPWKDRGR